jgi:hypothetical protein
MSDNHDYRDDHDDCDDHDDHNDRDDCDYRLYEIDRNNPGGFDEMSFLKHFMKKRKVFSLVSLFFRGP